jgi:Caspase domain/Domain of unknown function (DUF4384)
MTFRSYRTRLWGLCLGVAWAGTTAHAAGVQAPLLPSNHALIITVSEYQRSPLPGVLTDRKLATGLATQFGVPPQNIVQLSEQQVTREGLKQAFAGMSETIMPGDKLYVYFSGHGARYFNKATGQCTESIVMQDMHVVTNAEFAGMVKPLSAKADKTVVMLDSCHSGGVANAANSRALASPVAAQRPKFSAEASSPQCALAVNLGSFSTNRGADLNTTDHNLVILAASRHNEVAWDTSKGGALTYNFSQCLGGTATDTDHSGSLSMQELTDCVQARLDKTQEDTALQHATLVGNTRLVPAFSDTAQSAAPATPSPPTPIDTLATLNDIYNQRDDRWQVEAKLDHPTLKIGGNLSVSVRSPRDGFIYLFYQGSQPDSFYLLFPNQLDSANAISANQELMLPRSDWSVTALGPRGTDHLLVMVTETARDFSALALPAEYVSQAGPFEKLQRTPQAVARIGQIATLSAATRKPACQNIASRDLGVARQCSNVFGASLVSVEEID